MQEYERLRHASRRPGEPIADMYLDWMQQRAEAAGVVLVAEREGRFVGFVAGWIEETANIGETAESNRFGYVSDICVMPAFRGQRVAARLLDGIGRYLGHAGVSRLRVAALAVNASARASYEHAGFAPYEILYEKSIDGAPVTERRPAVIRQAEPADAAWIGDFLRARWGAGTIVVHGEAIEAMALPALVAENRRGLATYRRLGRDAELVTLDAVPAGIGTGTALIETLAAQLCAEGCALLWLTTTNGNLPALRFYQRRGFRLVQVRPGAVDAARKLKPSIPTIGAHGIPIHDELDLCRSLDDGAAERIPPPPWGRRS
ncbi:MAG TPA: GNAT family N-acetyltransferase [Stellaceae bacterium]|nr:GNAT family N-acetyltransferase [Stellaceae bacterium]